MKTFSAKPSDVKRQWYILDASDVPLGRLSTRAADLLTGKLKPEFTKHIDVGDYVIVINSDSLITTGSKDINKIYYRHTGFPGGIKSRSLKEQKEIDSTEVIRKSIRGMLPVNKLRDGRLARLKVYSGTEHNHLAQKPLVMKLKEGK